MSTKGSGFVNDGLGPLVLGGIDKAYMDHKFNSFLFLPELGRSEEQQKVFLDSFVGGMPKAGSASRILLDKFLFPNVSTQGRKVPRTTDAVILMAVLVYFTVYIFGP